jgi:hypothetical protein
MKTLTAEQKDALIDEVMEWVKKDIEHGDVTPLATLLRSCSTKKLVAYLPYNEMKLWQEKNRIR